MNFLPTYNFTPEQNTLFLRQILHLMVAHNISPNPINYTIWYEYVAGSNAKLKEAVDEIIKERNTVDSDTSFNLYKKHICHESLDSFEKISKNLQHLINQTTDSVKITGRKASKAGDSFEEKTIQLENITSLKELKNIITEIATETKGLAITSQIIHSELNYANEELDKLREELLHVREAANLDALTGLYNRGSFDETLGKLVDQESINETCLTLLDLDHFKRVNDAFGHLIGDKVLKYTASLIKQHVEGHHFVARYGGEELAIIMPDTALDKASEIAETIRESLEKSRLKRKNNSESIGQITLSIGIAVLKPGDTVETLIARADQALYKAKESGRNRVVNEILI